MNLEQSLAEYRDMQAELQPSLDALKRLEKEIKQHVIETGEVAEIDGASVKIRSGYTRTSWNGKALEGYAVANPDVLQFRTETEVSPAAVLKAG